MEITADTPAFITLDEFKAHLNKTGSDDDAELELFRSAAQDHVEALIGPVLWRTVTQSVIGRSTMVLHTLPVVSIDTVGGFAWQLGAYTADLGTGVVEGLSTAGRQTITYTAGRTDCPDSVRLATLIIAKHLWETQRGRASNRAGSAVEGEQRVPSGYLIPHRAEALLRPYMQMTGFA